MHAVTFEEIHVLLFLSCPRDVVDMRNIAIVDRTDMGNGTNWPYMCDKYNAVKLYLQTNGPLQV